MFKYIFNNLHTIAFFTLDAHCYIKNSVKPDINEPVKHNIFLNVLTQNKSKLTQNESSINTI